MDVASTGRPEDPCHSSCPLRLAFYAGRPPVPISHTGPGSRRRRPPWSAKLIPRLNPPGPKQRANTRARVLAIPLTRRRPIVRFRHITPACSLGFPIHRILPPPATPSNWPDPRREAPPQRRPRKATSNTAQASEERLKFFPLSPLSSHTAIPGTHNPTRHQLRGDHPRHASSTHSSISRRITNPSAPSLGGDERPPRKQRFHPHGRPYHTASSRGAMPHDGLAAILAW